MKSEYEHPNTLSGLPEHILVAIGETTLAAAWVESEMELAIWELLEVRRARPIHEGIAITSRMRTEEKRKLLFILSRAKIPKEHREGFANLLGNIRTLLNRRDRLAHPNRAFIRRMIGHEDEDIHYVHYTVDKKIKWQAEAFTIEELKRLPNNLYQAGINLNNFMSEWRKSRRSKTT